MYTHTWRSGGDGEITRVIHDVITMWFLVLTTRLGTGKTFAANEDEGWYDTTGRYEKGLRPQCRWWKRRLLVVGDDGEGA